jgi:hypothetical protein
VTPTLAAGLALMVTSCLVAGTRALLSMRPETGTAYSKFVQSMVPEMAASQTMSCGLFLFGVGFFQPVWYFAPTTVLAVCMGLWLIWKQGCLAFKIVRSALEFSSEDDATSHVDLVSMCAIIILPVPVVLWGLLDLAKMMDVL